MAWHTRHPQGRHPYTCVNNIINLIFNFVFSESTKKRKPELSDDAYSEKRSRKSEDKTSPTSASQGKRDKKSERKRVSGNISDTRKPQSRLLP